MVVRMGLVLGVSLMLATVSQAMSITEILLDPVTDSNGTTWPRYIEIDLEGREAPFDLVILNQGDYPEYVKLGIDPQSADHLVIAESDWPANDPPPSTTKLITFDSGNDSAPNGWPLVGGTSSVRHVLAMDGTLDYPGLDYTYFDVYRSLLPGVFPEIDTSLSLLINGHGQDDNFSTEIQPYTSDGHAFQNLGPGDAISRQLNNDLSYGEYSVGPVDENLKFEDGWTLSPGIGATPMSADDPPDDPPTGSSVPLPPAALVGIAAVCLLATRRGRR